ncbi:MAG: 50S ribosomal protein L1 [Chloroflexi bacterium]|nr:50S ribosomal protein L1 [Chloroflexota bacterium]MDK1045348.1 50S ribosomal protein L1 [Anaerolineales bacterium]MCH8342110.1 50S ribosomal protein L1 [Chloroflexota bacterium]MCI0773374.1 50S ribosomal protein L1 [Chloroflexota bacterium]MCI0806466.1 50S ribosomal protein L1 [Chloroflexota bacterium]
MARHGKKYRAAEEKIDRDQAYVPRKALELAQETSYTNFDSTIEVHLRLGVDPRHAEQQIRETVMLPHGLGKKITVVVFAEGDDARLASEAGADYVLDDELMERIKGGWTDFDATVATPSLMGKVGRLGKILGPRGLMPNPKAGTVVQGEDLPRVIDELKAGRVEFRLDRTANLHVPIGKASFDTDKLYDNMAALMDVIIRARPASAKGIFFRKIVVTSTMGPGVKVDANAAQAM